MRFALPASAALHAVVLYAAAQIDWSAPRLARSTVAPSVVWLEMRPTEPEPEEPSPPPDEEPPQDVEPARLSEEAPPEPVAPEPPAPEPEPADEAPRSAEESSSPAEPEAAPEPAPRRPVDWDAERRRAVVRMIQEREGSQRTFSLDDLPAPERPQGEGTPPTPIAEVMDDGCLIAKNRFQRMAMMMLGRCVREARDDLFADAMPSYLEKLPVCVDTREPGVPAVESASGREYPTVKCRLVEPEQP